jgi:hypothetical protein
VSDVLLAILVAAACTAAMVAVACAIAAVYVWARFHWSRDQVILRARRREARRRR